MKYFYQQDGNEKLWHVREDKTRFGGPYFTFDKKKIFNFWKDYPDNLTQDQKEIFDKEESFWAELYLESKQIQEEKRGHDDAEQ